MCTIPMNTKTPPFIVLNTNDVTVDGYLSDAQYDWAYETAKNAGTEWKIILLHKSPYSNGPHAQDDDVAAIRQPVESAFRRM